MDPRDESKTVQIPHDSMVSDQIHDPKLSPKKAHGSIPLALLAWVVILALASSMVWSVIQEQSAAQEEWQKSTESHALAPPPMELELVGKMAVGLADITDIFSDALVAQMQLSKDDPLSLTLCRVVVIGELDGPTAALDMLGELSSSIEKGNLSPLEDEIKLKVLLENLYADREGNKGDLPALSDENRTELKEKLRWFGELALLGPDTSDQAEREELIGTLVRVPIAIFAISIWYLFFGFAGFAAGIILLVLAFNNKLKSRLSAYSGRGLVYAETFAVWLVLFVGMGAVTDSVVSPDYAITASIVLSFLSLIAIGWPVIRGISWHQVRQDLGLTKGCGIIQETAAGILSYALAIPMLMIGFVVVMFLILVQKMFDSGGGDPSHPLQEMIGQGSTWDNVQFYIVACIAAPIVEEIMFRGVLYRHLREATGKFGFIASLIASALGTSFIFAVIHPQGWVFAPALMGLAFGFCVAREWRGSLIACITAHALTNFVTVTLNFMLFS